MAVEFCHVEVADPSLYRSAMPELGIEWVEIALSATLFHVGLHFMALTFEGRFGFVLTFLGNSRHQVPGFFGRIEDEGRVTFRRYLVAFDVMLSVGNYDLILEASIFILCVVEEGTAFLLDVHSELRNIGLRPRYS